MKGVAQIKCLPDLRTAVSSHYRNASRTKGTPYLEIMSLGMEKLRLESELEWLSKREARVRLRLAEITERMGARLNQVREDPPPGQPAPAAAAPSARGRGSWPVVAVDY